MYEQQISKSEFKAKALEFFRQIESSGLSVFVTDHGKPVIEIRPFRGAERKPLDVLRDSIVHYGDPTGPVAQDDWEAAR